MSRGSKCHSCCQKFVDCVILDWKKAPVFKIKEEKVFASNRLQVPYNRYGEQHFSGNLQPFSNSIGSVPLGYAAGQYYYSTPQQPPFQQHQGPFSQPAHVQSLNRPPSVRTSEVLPQTSSIRSSATPQLLATQLATSQVSVSQPATSQMSFSQSTTSQLPVSQPLISQVSVRQPASIQFSSENIETVTDVSINSEELLK